ncbi:hypothetical protein ACEPAI_2691 [Sanghuangporus weigelae]
MSEKVERGTASLTADSKKSSKYVRLDVTECDADTCTPRCTWYYGFHLKVRLVFAAIAVNKNIESTDIYLYDQSAVIDYIERSLPRLSLDRQVVRYRDGKTATVIYLHKVTGQITEEEKHHIAEKLKGDADNLRRVMGIRENKNAKWYEELNIDRNNDADSSDDDEWRAEST